MQELETLARYPFLKDAREYVASLNLSFEDILHHPIYSAAVQAGADRVRDCVEGKYFPKTGDRLRNEITILSYPLARMIASEAGRTALNRYAQGEADAAKKALAKENPQVVESVVKDLGLQVQEKEMDFIQYTQLSSALAKKNPRWKLVNRCVHEGKVDVSDDEVRDLLAQAVRERVQEPVDKSRIPDEIKKNAKSVNVAGAASDFKVDTLEDKALPPCMASLIADMQAGTAAHQGMFILATFLANLGLPRESILAVFSKSPKYDEEKASYQLEFVTGEKGGTEYTCPTCTTIKSYGLCRAECNVKHPLQYYRQRSKAPSKVIKKKKK